MPTSTLVEQFIQQGIYLRNWSPKTVRTYRQSLTPLALDQPLTKATLNAIVIAMRQKGLTPGGINVRLRSLNSFLTWLHEDGHAPERLRVKLLRAERKVLTTFSDNDIRKLLHFKAQEEGQHRTWTLILTLLDTGLRIEEALGLERSGVNLDGMTLTVLGKGHRQPPSPTVSVRRHRRCG